MKLASILVMFCLTAGCGSTVTIAANGGDATGSSGDSVTSSVGSTTASGGGFEPASNASSGVTGGGAGATGNGGGGAASGTGGAGVTSSAGPTGSGTGGQLPAGEWIKTIGASYGGPLKGLVADSAGNVITAGTFEGTIDFGNGPLTTPPFELECYLAKLDSTGKSLWSAMLASTTCVSMAIAIDGLDNVLLAGGTASALSLGGMPVTNTPGAFVVKLDPTGVVLWARALSTGIQDYALGVTSDSAGNVFVSHGAFTNDLPSGLTLSKLDVAGNEIWTKPLDGDGSYDGGLQIALACNSAGEVVFTANDAVTMFVEKVDSSGVTLWSNEYAGGYIGPLSFDAQGDVLIAGRQFGPIDFGVGSTSNDGLFVLKLDPSGAYVWSRQITEGSIENQPAAITMDAAGDAFVTGEYGQEPIGDVRGFLLELNADGATLDTQTFGAGPMPSPNDQADGEGIAVDSNGHVYIAGNFTGSMELLGQTFQSMGSNSIFIARISP